MNDWWIWVQATFNNREIVTGIWFQFAFILCLLHKDIRSGMWGVLKASMQIKLLILFGSLPVNVTGLCWLSSRFGLWSPGQLFPTILWIFLSGIALTGRALSAKEDEGYFKALFLDSFKIAGILEFLVVAYSFSLPVEFVLVPCMAFVGLMSDFAGIKKKHASVRTLFE